MAARYRASMCKAVLEHIEAVAPELVDQLPADALEPIRKSSRADWIAASGLEQIYAAIMQVGGEDRLREINRGYTHKAMSFSVFGPLVKGATNLFGGGPKGLLRVLPNSWDLVTRDCGNLAVQFPADGQAKIRYSELPDELRTPGFAVSSSASPMGILDGLGFRGSVETDSSRLTDGVLELLVQWSK